MERTILIRIILWILTVMSKLFNILCPPFPKAFKILLSAAFQSYHVTEGASCIKQFAYMGLLWTLISPVHCGPSCLYGLSRILLLSSDISFWNYLSFLYFPSYDASVSQMEDGFCNFLVEEDVYLLRFGNSFIFFQVFMTFSHYWTSSTTFSPFSFFLSLDFYLCGCSISFPTYKSYFLTCDIFLGPQNYAGDYLQELYSFSGGAELKFLKIFQCSPGKLNFVFMEFKGNQPWSTSKIQYCSAAEVVFSLLWISKVANSGRVFCNSS